MKTPEYDRRKRNRLRHILQIVRRAFVEFLTVPTLVIFGFMVLAAITYYLDRLREATATQHAGLLYGTLFSDPESIRNLLATIASSVITLASITFSLLLIAVQQGAAALTSQVYDQFLRRRANQFYFGFFIAVALYALVILSTTSPTHVPVYGVAFAVLMALATLYLLILLIYTTIDQMRPVMIIEAIQDHTLAARKRQLELLRRTRRVARFVAPVADRVNVDASGFLIGIDTDAIAKTAAKAGPDLEIVLLASIGSFVSEGDCIAEIKAAGTADLSALKKAVRAALMLDDQRDLGTDPAFGLEQLATIGWTSVSTAKSNPQPGVLVCWSLRRIMARWFRKTDREPDGHAGEAVAPVVYRDNVPEQLMDAFESLAVVASESMQHQTYAEVLRTLGGIFPDLPPSLQDRAEDVLLRSLSALGEHVLTRDLDEALSSITSVLRSGGRAKSADAIRSAQAQLARSIGRLNARSSRVGDSQTL